jgi:hypothetical protein
MLNHPFNEMPRRCRGRSINSIQAPGLEWCAAQVPGTTSSRRFHSYKKPFWLVVVNVTTVGKLVVLAGCKLDFRHRALCLFCRSSLAGAQGQQRGPLAGRAKQCVLSFSWESQWGGK